MKPYTLLLLLFNFLVFSQTPISKSLGEFSELKIYDLINVELIESTENKIEITGANTTDVIVIQKNDVLRIRMALHKSFNGSKTFIKLFYTKIHTIDVNEGAKVALSFISVHRDRYPFVILNAIEACSHTAKDINSY